MIKYPLYFYKTASNKEVVTDYILSFEKPVQNKIRTVLRILEEYGLMLLRTKWMKKIHHSPNLYELRISASKEIRLFLIGYSNQTFLIVHILVKKTQKIPQHELNLALKRAKEFI